MADLVGQTRTVQAAHACVHDTVRMMRADGVPVLLTLRAVTVVLLAGSSAGCHLVFDLQRDETPDAGLDAAPDSSVVTCPTDIPTFGIAQGFVGSFAPLQTVIGTMMFTVPGGDVGIYAADGDQDTAHDYTVNAGWGTRPNHGIWIHRGSLMFTWQTPPPAGFAQWPRVWRDQGGSVRLFLEVADQRYVATPDSDGLDGKWTATPLETSAALLPSDHIAGAALGGSRLLVAREADRTVHEIARDPATGELGQVLATTALVNADGAMHPSMTEDGCWLLFDRPEVGMGELWISIRGSDGRFGAPRKLLGASTVQDETWPSLSPDGTLFYSSWTPPEENFEKPVYRSSL